MDFKEKRPLHIAVDATCWSNDRGFGRFTRELVGALAARGSDFRYTLLFDRLPDRPVPEGVAVAAAKSDKDIGQSTTGTSSRSLDYIWKMGALARATRCDVFFYPAVYSYFPLLAATPCVVCYHDAIAERFPDLIFPTKLNFRFWQAKTALARLQTRRAMTVSQSSARDIEAYIGIPRTKIDVVTEGPDAAFRLIEDPSVRARARASIGVPDGAPFFVYVGGFNRHKNVLRLIAAFERALASRPDAHLAIVGNLSGKGFWDNVPELQAAATASPALAERVHFAGELPDAQLAELLNAASALVFPSLFEGFGLPAVEAMACGLPVLASDRGSLPEVVGEAGLLFDPEDVAAIARTLLAFLADPAMAARLAAAARERARRFTWERAAELAEGCFRRCAGGTP
ncbi:MAG: glycosyltransferase family 4 protein [Alphaproteobacteria bacterium]|nr:glycosyltransferase family 4 protein [Alphaproteobacteria bacterium]